MEQHSQSLHLIGPLLLSLSEMGYWSHQLNEPIWTPVAGFEQDTLKGNKLLAL